MLTFLFIFCGIVFRVVCRWINIVCFFSSPNPVRRLERRSFDFVFELLSFRLVFTTRRSLGLSAFRAPSVCCLSASLFAVVSLKKFFFWYIIDSSPKKEQRAGTKRHQQPHRASSTTQTSKWTGAFNILFVTDIVIKIKPHSKAKINTNL